MEGRIMPKPRKDRAWKCSVLSQVGDALELNGDGGRQGADFHGGPAGPARGVHVFEVLAVDPVPRAEIALHVGQEHGDVDQVLPTRPFAFTLANTPRAWASKSNSTKLPLWS